MLFLDSVSLPKTLAAWKAGESKASVSDVLAMELQGEAISILGDVSSDDESVETLDLTFDEDRLRARFAIHFVEVIPSGCPDHPQRRDGRVEHVIVMYRDSVDGVFEENQSDPGRWDVWDRNSAADGY